MTTPDITLGLSIEDALGLLLHLGKTAASVTDLSAERAYDELRAAITEYERAQEPGYEWRRRP